MYKTRGGGQQKMYIYIYGSIQGQGGGARAKTLHLQNKFGCRKCKHLVCEKFWIFFHFDNGFRIFRSRAVQIRCVFINSTFFFSFSFFSFTQRIFLRFMVGWFSDLHPPKIRWVNEENGYEKIRWVNENHRFRIDLDLIIQNPLSEYKNMQNYFQTGILKFSKS